MAFDFNEAREIIEAAKKRGMIRSKDEPPPAPRDEPKDVTNVAIPDWLRESIADPSAPTGFTPSDYNPEDKRPWSR
jgi:hypothetical protein